MGDPLSVASGVAGLISLGLSVVQSLQQYYSQYRSQDVEVQGVKDKLVIVRNALSEVNQYVEEAKNLDDVKIQKINSSMEACRDDIDELREISEKCSKDVDTKTLGSRMKTASRRALYPLVSNDTVKRLDGRLTNVHQNLSLVLALMQLKKADQTLTEARTLHSEVRTAADHQLLKDILRWLNAPDPSSDFINALEQRHPETGAWFIQSPAFTDWLEGDGGHYIWLFGFAGTGKSVLSSTIIEKTQQHIHKHQNTALAYFYFTFRDALKQEAHHLTCSIVHQLAQQLPIKKSDSLVMLYQRYKSSTPPQSELLKLLHSMVLEFDRVHFIVDALDESPEHLGKREKALSTITTMRSWNLDHLNIIVTSRDYVDVRDALFDPNTTALEPSEMTCRAHWTAISLHNSSVATDIANYINSEIKILVQKGGRYACWSKMQDEIQGVLTEKANGMFRWVECQLSSLKKMPQNEKILRKRLHALPMTLDETYDRILEDLDEDAREYARRLLILVCFAKYPLTLDQVGHAIAVNVETELFDEEDCFSDEANLLSICQGLVTITVEQGSSNDDSDRDEPDEEDSNETYSNEEDVSEENSDYRGQKNYKFLGVAHFSVQEYLMSNHLLESPKLSCYHLAEPACSSYLSKLCLLYMSMFGIPENKKNFHSRAMEMESPFIGYSISEWLTHYRSAALYEKAIDPQLEKLIRGFFVYRKSGDDVFAFSNWLRLCSSAAWSFSDKSVIPTSLSWELWRLSASLFNASLYGVTIAIQPLIDALDIYIKDMSISGVEISKGEALGCAVQAASRSNQLRIVQLLVKQGAKVDVIPRVWDPLFHDDNPEPPIYWAVRRGSLELLQYLNANGASLTLNPDSTPLILNAALFGYKDIVQWLVGKGQIIKTRYDDKTVLSEAIHGGHLGLVQYCLEQGFDVRERAEGSRALACASTCLSRDIISLLIKHGADPSLKKNGLSYVDCWLIAAARACNPGIINYFLDLEVDGVKLDLNEVVVSTALSKALPSLPAIDRLDLNEAVGFDEMRSEMLKAQIMHSILRETMIISFFLDKLAEFVSENCKAKCLVWAMWLPRSDLLDRLISAGIRIGPTSEGVDMAVYLAAMSNRTTSLEKVLDSSLASVRQVSSHQMYLDVALHYAILAIRVRARIHWEVYNDESVPASSYLDAVAPILEQRPMFDDEMRVVPYLSASRMVFKCLGDIRNHELSKLNKDKRNHIESTRNRNSSDSLPCLRLLLSRGANLNAYGAGGTALTTACLYGLAPATKDLIEIGADVNMDGDFGTALQAAAWAGDTSSVEMLLEAGADIHASSVVFGNALHVASIENHEEIRQLLIDRGAKETPLPYWQESIPGFRHEFDYSPLKDGEGLNAQVAQRA